MSRADEALRLLEDRGLARSVVAPHAHLASAQLSLRRADLTRTRRDLDAAERLLPRLRALPWAAVDVRLRLATSRLGLGEAAEARRLASDAECMLSRYPDAGIMLQRLEHVHDCLQSMSWTLEPLTSAELRVLRLLPSYLSAERIGEQEFISRNTVKTHMKAIYRKLGVGTRADAVDRARELGVIAEPSLV